MVCECNKWCACTKREASIAKWIEECTKKASKYFADSRPEMAKNSETEFQTIKDRSLRGEKVEIVLNGVMRSKSDNDAKEINIQCTASRSRETEWVLVYQDNH